MLADQNINPYKVKIISVLVIRLALNSRNS